MERFWLVAGVIALYFAPSVVAFNRNHTSRWGVLVINLFLGWTFIGWVGALAWAVSGKYPPAENAREVVGDNK